ncbi:MAG: RelA/SpoT domain-containing protein [Cellulosilyticaceae bacterium]
MLGYLNQEEFVRRYPFILQDIEHSHIDWDALEQIYVDYNEYKETYTTQADFIANTLRTHPSIHTVKSRIKDGYGLLEKIIRKTEDRQRKYGEAFHFTVDNYKEEINDLIGIRVIHIFKQDWEAIHEFINNTWKVIEITANVREGDDTDCFDALDITVVSRKSGYRSVHYLIEFYPTSQKVIAEIQVRTIFEEGYGEIDHKLRYSHKKIPEVMESNLMLFNRIAGSADEMASFINLLNQNWCEMEKGYEGLLAEKEIQIKALEKQLLKLKQRHE